MALKRFKPVTPSNRYKVWSAFDEITKDTPEKKLVVPLKRSGGRNNQGRITCRHIGGGHKRNYRLVDFKRKRTNDPAKVIGIEYDPNRTARIALIEYEDGERSYILAPVGVGGRRHRAGRGVSSSESWKPPFPLPTSPSELPSITSSFSLAVVVR